MKNTLNNKTILITGSSKGIGAATARILVRNFGAKVILHGKSKSSHLLKIADELKMPYIFCPIEDGKKVNEQIDQLLQKHEINILINCAGIMHAIDFQKLEDEDWINEFRVNLLGTVHFCKKLIPCFLAKKEGTILNISSIRGISEHSGTYNMAYSVSKAAVINLTASLAKEYGDILRIISIAPGFTKTDMGNEWPPEMRSKIEKLAATPEEVGEKIAELLLGKIKCKNGDTYIAGHV